MRTARKLVLLAALGQSACASSVQVKDPPAKAEVKFREDRPDLPAGTACLERPMTHYWYVSSTWRDPKHSFVPHRHFAIDFPAPVGTPVLAAAPGKVARIGAVEPGKDAFVSVRFADGWTFAAHHLSRVDVTEGQEVALGETLGLSGGKVDAAGSGPYTTGPHLHFSVAYEGVFVNPLKYFCDP
jgi:murein DD-endopeptidase MepM/ murein hydrolase activator NlpD